MLNTRYLDLGVSIWISQTHDLSSKTSMCTHRYLNTDLGPELQCLLKVKEYLDYVLIFQHAIINAN